MRHHEQAAGVLHFPESSETSLLCFSRHMRASVCTCHTMSSLQRCCTCLEAQKKLALFQQTHDSICVHMPPHEQAAGVLHFLESSETSLVCFNRHMRASMCTCHPLSSLQRCCTCLEDQKKLALFQQTHDSISVHMPPHEQAAGVLHFLESSETSLVCFNRHMRASMCTCHPLSSLQRCCTCLEDQKKLALFQQTHDSISVHMPPHEQAAKLQHLLGSPKQLIDFSRHMRASGCTCHSMSSLQRCGTCLEAQKKLALFQQTHDSICVHMPPHEQAAKLQHLLRSPKQLIDFIRHMRASVCTCHTMSRLQVCCPSLKAQKNLALFQQTHDSISVHMPPHEQAAKLQHLLGSPKQLIDFSRHMRASGCTCHPMSSLQRCCTCLEAQKKLALFQQTHDSICVHMPPHEQAAKLQHLLGSPKQLIDFSRHMRASVCTCHTMSRLQVCCPSLKAQKQACLISADT